MIALTLGEVADLVGGRVHDGAAGIEITGPAFLDSRTPEPGGLFAAFVGEQVDGHAYVTQAIAGGAAAVLGLRPTGVPTVVVDDVRAALQELARRVLLRRRAQGGDPLRAVAITGSQGKTSVKDMLARVLEDDGLTVATSGSLNNELGVPLTVLRTTTQTRHLVLEMGARGVGHLAELCRIVEPDVSVVLNVGKAHLGEFGSREQIALAKGELVEALAPDGDAVLNLDDPLVAPMAGRTAARVTWFGSAEAADVRLGEVTTDELGRPSFVLSHDGQDEPVRLQVVGRHQATNAAAAAAAALVLGVPLAGVARSLRRLTGVSRWRMELHERGDGLVVVNDAYNASPDSMRAALETLAGLGASSGRRTVAVLGEMRELGPDSAAEHAAIGRLVDDLGIDQTVVVGVEAAEIAAAINHRSTRQVGSVDEAVAWLRHNVQRTDLVLVKASRGARLERIADALLVEESGEEVAH